MRRKAEPGSPKEHWCVRPHRLRQRVIWKHVEPGHPIIQPAYGVLRELCLIVHRDGRGGDGLYRRRCRASVSHRLEAKYAHAGVSKRVLHHTVDSFRMLGCALELCSKVLLRERSGLLWSGLLPQAMHGCRAEATRELFCVEGVRELEQCACANGVSPSKQTGDVLRVHRGEVLKRGQRRRRKTGWLRI